MSWPLIKKKKRKTWRRAIDETLVLEQPNQNYHESITNLFQRDKHHLLPWFSLLVKLPQPRWPPAGSQVAGNFPAGPQGTQYSPAGRTEHASVAHLCSLLLKGKLGPASPPGARQVASEVQVCNLAVSSGLLRS